MSIKEDLMNAATADLLEQFIELEKHVQAFPDKLKDDLSQVTKAIEELPSNIDSKLKVKLESIFELVEEAQKAIDSDKENTLKSIQEKVAILEASFIQNVSSNTLKALDPVINRLVKVTETINQPSILQNSNVEDKSTRNLFITAFMTLFIGIGIALGITTLFAKPVQQNDSYKGILASFLTAQENALNTMSKQCAVEFKTNFNKEINKK